MDAEYGKRILTCGCEYWGSQLVPCTNHDTSDDEEFIEREEAILNLDAEDLHDLELKLVGE